MSLSPSQRLASIDDLLLYRLGRLSSTAGALVVRLCEGGYGITRREWAVVAQLYENGGLPPSVLAERMHRDRARTLVDAMNAGLATRKLEILFSVLHRLLFGVDRPAEQVVTGGVLEIPIRIGRELASARVIVGIAAGCVFAAAAHDEHAVT